MLMEAVLLIKYTISYCVCGHILDHFITVPDSSAEPNYGSGKKLRFLRFRFRNTVHDQNNKRVLGPGV